MHKRQSLFAESASEKVKENSMLHNNLRQNFVYSKQVDVLIFNQSR